MVELSSDLPPDSSPGYLIRIVHQRGIAAIERALNAEGLNGTQWMAMALLHFGLVHTSAELARNLCYDKGAMTRLVDALYQRGWIERCRAAEDRRRLLLALTPAGHRVALEGRRKVLALWNEWVADWSAGEVMTFTHLLQRLSFAIGEAG